MAKLRLGDKIPLAGRAGEMITVVQARPEKLELGEGAQGYVYKVVDSSGTEFALKWYKRSFLKELERIGSLQTDPRRKTSVKQFYENLVSLSNVEPPSDSFIWPKAVTMAQSGKTFGYLMDLIPSSFTPLVDILNRYVGMSFGIMCEACINLCDAFESLHDRGYSYQDLNYGGVYIDINNGNVLVCDNDNVAPDGNSITNIKGFPGFMAPEIVMEEDFPSRISDTHSLAVTLFYLTMYGHPLEGRNEGHMPARTEGLMRLFYGKNAEFIFEPGGSNQPVRGVHDLPIAFWDAYPQFFKDAFSSAFSRNALHGATREDRAKARLDERQWRNVFARLRSQLVECPRCHERIFADPANSVVKCPINGCGHSFSFPISLRVAGMDPIPILGGKVVYRSDVEPFGDCHSPALKFGTAKQNPRAIGLINLGSLPWTLTFPNGQILYKQPGESQIITDGRNWHRGMRIQFGQIDATIS